jgi:Acetyltransferases
MTLIAIPSSEISLIRPLWEELNAHHLERSTHFKAWFSDYTFDKHLDMRIRGKELLAEAVEEEGAYRAFCISTIDSIGRGEIDSLYVRPERRGSGLGRLLVESALAWLGERRVSEVLISTAGGNEEVFGFYAKFGFYPSGHILRTEDEVRG